MSKCKYHEASIFHGGCVAQQPEVTRRRQRRGSIELNTQRKRNSEQKTSARKKKNKVMSFYTHLHVQKLNGSTISGRQYIKNIHGTAVTEPRRPIFEDFGNLCRKQLREQEIWLDWWARLVGWERQGGRKGLTLVGSRPTNPQARAATPGQP